MLQYAKQILKQRFLYPREYFGLQVTGMIEGFFGGLIFDSADVWVGKFGKYFLGGLI